MQTVLLCLCFDFLQICFMKILIWYFLQESPIYRWLFLWYRIRIFIFASFGLVLSQVWVPWGGTCEFQNGTRSGVPWDSSRSGMCESTGRGRLSLAWCFLRCVALSAKDACYLLFSSVASVEWSIEDSLLLKFHQRFRSYYLRDHYMGYVCEAYTEFDLYSQLIQNEWLPHL